MIAEQWSDFFDRTKRQSGVREALRGLFDGMVRELKSRARRADRGTHPSEVVQDVLEIYAAVAEDHEELHPDGLESFLKGEIPELYSHLEDYRTILTTESKTHG